MFKEALVWSTSDNPKTEGNPIYAIKFFAKLVKELNIKDVNLLKSARNQAIELLANDPSLSNPQNLMIKSAYIEISKKSTLWANIS